jgi:hypothetical protein
MDIISEAGISETYDLNQADLGIVQIDEGGKSMTLTITRPIADFHPLDDEFGGIAQICASMPLVPRPEVARPGSSNGNDGGLLARPEMGEADETPNERPDNIQEALFTRPIPITRSLNDGGHSEERVEEEEGIRSLNSRDGQTFEERDNQRRSSSSYPARLLNGVRETMWSLTTSRGMQQLPLPQQSDVETADVCLSITLGDSFDGSPFPTVIPPSGLQVCHCDSSNACIDESTPSSPVVSGTNQDNNELRICLSGLGNNPLVDIPFLQLDGGPSGESTVLIPYGDGANINDSTAANGLLLLHPEATFELQPGGQAVMTFPLEDIFTDPSQPPGVVTVSGMVLLGDSEESFQLVVDFSESESETPDVLEELNLSNVKEVVSSSRSSFICCNSCALDISHVVYPMFFLFLSNVGWM